MQIRSIVAGVGVGMLAGAAAILMIPRHSEVYRVADDAAHAIKHEATRMMHQMRN